MTENSLQFSRNLNFDEWESVGLELFRVQAAWQWWVGDWLNYGEKKYGQTYEQALAVTGKSLSSLQKVRWVAAEFEPCDRSQLSWTHHYVAASLPEDVRDQVLAEAEENGLPVKWVRSRVAEIKGLPVTEPDEECDADETHEEVIEHAAELATETAVVTAFANTENRLSVLRRLLDQLNETERLVVLSWLSEAA